MLEARTFVSNIDKARKTLLDNGAIFKGEYICKDIIFAPTDPTKTLKDTFLRLRINVKNIWSEKDVIVAIKQTEKKDIGKNSIIPLRKEFDSEPEARKFIDENLTNDFKYDFEFTRTGWQYDLGENQVDLEKVEDLPNCYTIEVKSKTEEGLKGLVDMLGITSLIEGPSVVEMKKLLSPMTTELAHSFNVVLDPEADARLRAEQDKLRIQFKEQRAYDSSPHLAIATKFMGEEDTQAFISALENEFRNDTVCELEFADFRISDTGDYIFLHLSENSEQKLVDLHKRAFEATKGIGLEVQTGRKFRNFPYHPHISIIKILPEEAEKALALVREDLSAVTVSVNSFQITRQKDLENGFSEFPIVGEIKLH